MKILFICFLLLPSFPAFSQVEIINQDLTNPSVNFFYVGVENRIKLKTINNLSGYNVTGSGAAGSIDKINDNEYIIRVSGNDTCSVVVTRNRKIILTKKYKTEFLGSPVASLNGVRDTSVSGNKILLNPFLVITIPNCYFNHRIRVLSFQAVFITQSDSITTNSVGHSFSSEQMKLTKQLTIGDKILFNTIRGSCSSSRIQALQPFWIKVE